MGPVRAGRGSIAPLLKNSRDALERLSPLGLTQGFLEMRELRTALYNARTSPKPSPAK